MATTPSIAGKTALHPGMTSTAFSAEDPLRVMAPIVAVLRPFMRSPERGADTAIYLASSPEVEGVTGRYFADRKAKKSHESSHDSATTARLWQVSADLVGLPVEARLGTSWTSHVLSSGSAKVAYEP